MTASEQRTEFFTQNLADRDPELFGSTTSEHGRQRDEIELSASARCSSSLCAGITT